MHDDQLPSLRFRVCSARAGIAGALSLSMALAGAGCQWFDGQRGEPREQRAPSVRITATERLESARSLRSSGDDAAALAELAQAIRENPTLTTAFLEIGEIHRETGNYEAAESAYQRAAQLEPNNFDAQYGHGLVLQLMNRLVDAVQKYLRALSLRPNDRDANLNLATAYLQLQEPTQALPYARRAVQVEPSHGPSRVNLGAVYAALNRHREAVLEYEAAAEHMDLTPQLLLNLADSLGKIERHREMANTLERLVQIEPSAQAYERLGYAYFKQSRLDDALDAFRRAVDLDARHYPALNGVGVTLLNQWVMGEQRDEGLRREGVGALQRSLRIDPRQPRIVELVSRYK